MEGLCQDYEKGGLRITVVETMIKAPRLEHEYQDSYGRAIPIGNLFQTFFLKKYGGLYFLLSCNYDVRDFLLS